MTEHRCNMHSPWPIGHPLPPEDPARLQGPEVGATVTYHRVRRTGQYSRELDTVVYTEDIADLPATVKERSYVWSPGECRHKGGYRRYDWTVVEVHEPERSYTVVVDDADLTP
jgi:hypothetical protein